MDDARGKMAEPWNNCALGVHPASGILNHATQ